MEYKDTLALYDDLRAGGCTEDQARVQAKQLGAVGNALEILSRSLVSMEERINKNLIRMEGEIKQLTIKMDKDMYWVRLIGGAMIIAFATFAFKISFR